MNDKIAAYILLLFSTIAGIGITGNTGGCHAHNGRVRDSKYFSEHIQDDVRIIKQKFMSNFSVASIIF